MSSLQKVKHKFYLLMSKQRSSSRDISIDTSSVSSCRDVHMWRNLANIRTRISRKPDKYPSEM